jgi:hypothetical protein
VYQREKEVEKNNLSISVAVVYGQDIVAKTKNVHCDQTSWNVRSAEALALECKRATLLTFVSYICMLLQSRECMNVQGVISMGRVAVA